MIEELELTNLDTFCYKYGTIQPQKELLLANQGKIITDSVKISDYQHKNSDARFKSDHVQIHILHRHYVTSQLIKAKKTVIIWDTIESGVDDKLLQIMPQLRAIYHPAAYNKIEYRLRQHQEGAKDCGALAAAAFQRILLDGKPLHNTRFVQSECRVFFRENITDMEQNLRLNFKLASKPYPKIREKNCPNT